MHVEKQVEARTTNRRIFHIDIEIAILIQKQLWKADSNRTWEW